MLVPVLLAASLGHFDVFAPEELAGNWPDVPGSFGPPGYAVNGQVALAKSCPCLWLRENEVATESLLGTLLLVPDGICGPGCDGALVACAASYHNASGLLISIGFNSPITPPSPPAAPAPPPPTEAVATAVSVERDLLEAKAALLGCSSSLPASFIGSNMSAALAEAVTWNYTLLPEMHMGEPNFGASDVVGVVPDTDEIAINVTIYRRAEDSPRDCTKYAMVPLVYVATVPIWLMLTISWTWNTYYANAGYARDLHRLMCWVPIMESVHGLLSLFNYFSCPWESVLSLVYATFWSIVTILKEPVMLLCLLLVAKGWCITRHFLHRREVCVAGSILALLYASVSVQMSLRSPLATVPMVIMYVAMLVEISWSIFNNLRILKAQLLALRSLGVDPRTTPAFTKYIMFKRLAYATALYAVLELVIHWTFSGGRFEEQYWLFIALHQTMELIVAASIGLTFRAQPFNILFQQVQQVAAELADQMLPSITTIEVKSEVLQGDNLIAWRSDLGLDAGRHPTRPNEHLPPTLVVLNPGDTELPNLNPMPRRLPAACQHLASAAAAAQPANASGPAAAPTEQGAAASAQESLPTDSALPAAPEILYVTGASGGIDAVVASQEDAALAQMGEELVAEELAEAADPEPEFPPAVAPAVGEGAV